MAAGVGVVRDLTSTPEWLKGSRVAGLSLGGQLWSHSGRGEGGAPGGGPRASATSPTLPIPLCYDIICSYLILLSSLFELLSTTLGCRDMPGHHSFTLVRSRSRVRAPEMCGAARYDRRRRGEHHVTRGLGVGGLGPRDRLCMSCDPHV